MAMMLAQFVTRHPLLVHRNLAARLQQRLVQSSCAAIFIVSLTI
jgi:hypothetical protein